MTENDLAVFYSNIRAHLYLALNGFGHTKKSCTNTDWLAMGNIGNVWRKDYVFKFNKALT